MGRRVLIIEDHAESAEGLAEILSIWGHEPHIAEDGSQALALVSALEPDAVISDLGLPDIDGLELCRRIRGMTGGDGILLVALSGRSVDEVIDSPFDYGFRKPVDLAALEELLGG